MAQLTFPISTDGLALTALIGLARPAMQSLTAAGMTIPRPITARAIIDTGSGVSCVSAAIISILGIPPTSQSSTYTASGQVPVRLFDVSFSVPSADPAVILVIPDLTIMELPVTIPRFDAVIGLDVLLQTRLIIDGPAYSFTIDF
jgi:hypothetical protein